MMNFGSRVIHVDLFSQLADYSKFPRADLTIITYENRVHCDIAVIDQLSAKNTIVVLEDNGARKRSGGMAMRNVDIQTVTGIMVEAVPAYNIMHMPDNG